MVAKIRKSLHISEVLGAVVNTQGVQNLPELAPSPQFLRYKTFPSSTKIQDGDQNSEKSKFSEVIEK